MTDETQAVATEDQAVAKKVRATPRKAFPKTGNIHLLVDSNPKRPNSKSYVRFAQYFDGISVADALAAGVTTSDLQYDVAKGYIEVR